MTKGQRTGGRPGAPTGSTEEPGARSRPSGVEPRRRGTAAWRGPPPSRAPAGNGAPAGGEGARGTQGGLGGGEPRPALLGAEGAGVLGPFGGEPLPRRPLHAAERAGDEQRHPDGGGAATPATALHRARRLVDEGALARRQLGQRQRLALVELARAPQRLGRAAEALPLGDGGLEAQAGGAAVGGGGEPAAQPRPAADPRLLRDLVHGRVR